MRARSMLLLSGLVVIVPVSLALPFKISDFKTFGTHSIQEPKTEVDRLLDTTRQIMKSSNSAFLSTIDKEGKPRTRLVDPYDNEGDLTKLLIITRPLSRKIDEIEHNPHATLAFYDKKGNGYVCLFGEAHVARKERKNTKNWKASWDKYYYDKKPAAGQDKDLEILLFSSNSKEAEQSPSGYVFIEFKVKNIEMVHSKLGAKPKGPLYRPIALGYNDNQWAVLDKY